MRLSRDINLLQHFFPFFFFSITYLMKFIFQRDPSNYFKWRAELVLEFKKRKRRVLTFTRSK